VWLWCERCQHHAPFACAAVIRWGPNDSSDKLRAAARCTSCGSTGATVQHQTRLVIMLASVHLKKGYAAGIR
jgi:Zn finger protein HypA/HybF involved in hydrogenase expression